MSLELPPDSGYLADLAYKDAGPLPRVSRFGLISAFLFIVLSFVGRFLFPFGDEPDFPVRSEAVQSEDGPWWSPYTFFHDVFDTMRRTGECEITATPFSIMAHIATGCGEDLEQILTRFAITILLSVVLILPIIFRHRFVKMIDPLYSRLSPGEWTLRLDALTLALLLPSVVSALGVFAEEQFVVMLSLLLILVAPNLIWTAFLLGLVFGLDFGNGLVVATTVLLLGLNRFLFNHLGFRRLVMIVVIELAVIMALGVIFVDLLTAVGFLAEKAGGLSAMLTQIDSPANKYPVILRPIVTFMTGVYMTGLNVKVVPLYLVFIVAIIACMAKFRRLSEKPAVSSYGFAQSVGTSAFDEVRLYFLTAINIVLLFVFLLPTYGNAKYYLFLVPFVLIGVLQVYTKYQVRTLFISSSITVFIFLILFRIF